MTWTTRQIVPAATAALLVALAAGYYLRSGRPVKKSKKQLKDRLILPGHVRPVHYAVHITPDFVDYKYKGEVDITLQVLKDTSTLTFNAIDLDVHSAYVTTDTQKLFATDISYEKQLERCTLKLDGTLLANTTVTLHVDFAGVHNDDMCGFYRSGYTGANGDKQYMVVTQFEATHARKALPCWDEPNLKATFDVTLTVPEQYTALSNMNTISETRSNMDGGLKTVVFATTPIMSTYLLAFAVGDFEYIEQNTSGEHNGRPVCVRVYTLPGLSNQGHFALDCAVKTLEFFAGVFGIAYPLPKMDMIAVPDFDAGAMENWGLVTYRTIRLLWDPKTSSASTKQEVAYVVAHELAHQWFGNLVTMEWWSELWLNEGFATWVGWFAVDHLFPEWHVWNGFISNVVQRGMELDALRSSHPIQVELQSASDVNQIFDAISYSKGASVIRMLSFYLGQDTFLAGIRRYLKRHQYSNATTDDLWAALSEESGRDVAEFMRNWTTEIGYPVLTVLDHDKNTFHVKQHRFLSSGDVAKSEDKTVWWIPLNVSSEQGPITALAEKDAVLMSKEGYFKKPANSSFYKLNYGQTGLYRVLYPRSKLTELGQAIQKGQLETADRVGLIADAATLAESGIGNTADLLELIHYYVDEKEYIVWSEIATRLDALRSVWFEEPQDVQDALKRFTCKLFAPLVSRLGWDSTPEEDFLTQKLRALAVAKAAGAGDVATISEAMKRFNAYVGGDEASLDANIRGVVLCIAVANGNAATWDTVLDIYTTTATADQKVMALSALGYAKQPDLIQKALAFSLSSSVRSNEVMYVHNALSVNTQARYALWTFVKENWGEFEKRYASSLGLFAHVVRAGVARFSKLDMLQDIEGFFSDKDTVKVDRPLKQSIEKLKVNAKWLSVGRNQVAEWIVANKI
jgi:aminopeptidase 2